MVSRQCLHLLLIPYDGKLIGEFISDAMERLNGTTSADVLYNNAYTTDPKNILRLGYATGYGVNVLSTSFNRPICQLYYDNILGVRVAYETRGASISVDCYISY